MALIPFLLLVIPILEIVVFIIVGGQIGLWPTLGFILLTAVIGSILLRWQGINTIRTMQADLAASRLPARALGDGMMLVAAGILLLTPGFVTDTIGFSLFIPPVRHAIFNFFKSRINVVSTSGFGGGFETGQPKKEDPSPQPSSNGGSGKIVDLDESEFETKDPNPDSPWNK